MSTEWTTFQSFQKTQGLLEDVSSLVLWLQLADAGVPPPPTFHRDDVEEAADRVGDLLQYLADAATAAGDDQLPLLGASARTRALARRFAVARHAPGRATSALFGDDLGEVIHLVEIGPEAEGDDRRRLLASLRDLRTLLDEHVHDDAIRLLGGDF